MKSFFCLLVFSGLIFGQAYRVDPTPILTTSGATNSGGGRVGNPVLSAVPYAAITVCNYPGNGIACTNLATTYTDATGLIACPSNMQVVLAKTNTCMATTDGSGNFGFWLAPGNYSYSVLTPAGVVSGPYPLSAGSGNAGGGLLPPSSGSGLAKVASGSQVTSIATGADLASVVAGTINNSNNCNPSSGFYTYWSPQSNLCTLLVQQVNGGSGIAISGTAAQPTVSLSAPVSIANGGTGVSIAQGNGNKVQLSSGSTTANDCVKFDVNGNTVDAGAACGSSGGSITSVIAGTGLSGGGSSGAVTVNLATPVTVGNGGTGTASPSIVAGSNVTVTGTWPNQTINSSGGAAFPGTQLATSNGTSTTGIAASITACGTSISCSVIAPPSYGTSESVPGFSTDPNNPFSCTTSANIIIHDQRYNDAEMGCNFLGYVQGLQRMQHAWNQMSYTALPAGQILSIINLQQDIYGGTANYQVNGVYGNKNTAAPFVSHSNAWANLQHVNLNVYTDHHGLGDTLGIANYVHCHQGGFIAQADEGCEAQDNQVFQGDGNNWYAYTGGLVGPISPGATTVTVSPNTGSNLRQEPGGYLVDMTQVYNTGTLSSITFSGGLTTFTFSGTSFPVSTAYGTLNTGISAPNSTVTVTPTFTSGAISNITTSTPICVSGPSSEELVYPSAVSGSTFTATFTNPYATGANFSVAGRCGWYVNPTADDITQSNWTTPHIQTINGTIRFAFPVVRSDATHLYVHVSSGGYYQQFYSKLTNSANGYNIWPGVQVLDVHSASSGGISNTMITTPVPITFANADSMEELPFPEPHYIFGNDVVESYQQSVGGSTQGSTYTLNQQLHDSDILFHPQFSAPAAFYKTYGGPLLPPTGIQPDGIFNVGLQFTHPAYFHEMEFPCDNAIPSGQIGNCTGADRLILAIGNGSNWDGIGYESSTKRVFALNNNVKSYINGGSSGNATSIQGQAVSATAATNGQALVYNSGSSQYIPSTLTTLQNGLGTTKTGTTNVQVNVSMSVRAFTGTSDTLVNTDCGGLVTYNNSSAVAVAVPQAGLSGNFLSGCPITLRNYGAGTVTITPTPSGSTIGNGASTQTVTTNKACLIVSDGVNYQLGNCN